MSQHRPNKNKVANPLQKPWSKTDKTIAGKTDRNNGVVKPQVVKAVKSVQGDEIKVYSPNACRVLFEERPESVIRLYVSEKVAPKFSDVMKSLAASKKAYHIVDDAELDKISASTHHGGIVMLVKRKPIKSLAVYLQQKGLKKDCLLALDDISNAHNLGAIARTCAHFGISGVIMREPQLLHSGASLRTAEGGGEYVDALKCDDMPLALRLCKEAGYTLVTTSSHGGQSLYQTALPEKVVIVFGEEMFGVSKNVAKAADIALQIPGTGKVESLNVSVAASLILGEWYRQQQA